MNDALAFLGHRFQAVRLQDKAVLLNCPGLRQAKLSYFPLDIFPVFDLTLRDDQSA